MTAFSRLFTGPNLPSAGHQQRQSLLDQIELQLYIQIFSPGRGDQTDELQYQRRHHKMAERNNEFEILAPSGFEWDQDKSELNRSKHGLDFEDAIDVFYGPILLRRSDRNNEKRWIATGYSEDRLVAVVFTRRADIIRIISARRARKNEEREYRNAKMGRPPQGQD
jgi:uncharacterized DUF497 family protein